MNMTARALAVNPLTWERQELGRWPISAQAMGILLLMLAVLSSALSVVYVRALQRNLYSELQLSEQTRDELKTEWSQLLLEKNTWAAPERVQLLAQATLGMQLPRSNDTILLT